MNSARDKPTGKTIWASDFDKEVAANPQARHTYKGRLQCPGCGREAHFRKRSRDGRPPLFYSTQHQDDCELSARREETEPGELEATGEPFSNSGGVLVLRGVEVPREPISHADGTATGAKVGTSIDAGRAAASTDERSLALSQMLFQLEKGIDFTGRSFELPEIGQQLGEDVIRRFDQLDHRDTAAQWRIVWGAIFSAGRSYAGWWLNHGPTDAEAPVIFIPGRFAEDILATHRKQQLDSIGETRGWRVIAFGQVFKTGDGRPRLDLQDPSMLVLRRPRAS